MSEPCEICGRPIGLGAGRCPCGTPHVYEWEEECYRIGYERTLARADRSEAEFCACKALLIAAQKRAERAEAERATAVDAREVADKRRALMEAEADRNLGHCRAAEQRASEARAALLSNGVHDAECPAYKQIGRMGSRSGLHWSAGDEKRCACVLGRALAALSVEPARRPEQKEIQRDGDTPSAPSTAAIRAQALEDAAQAAEAIGKECEQEWLDLGGEEGGPSWMQTIPSKDYVRNCRRYAGAGGADAAEEIAKRIRAGAARDAKEAAPLSNLNPPSPTGDAE